MRRLLTAVLLFLVAGAACADTGALTQAQQFSAGLTPPQSDYSVAYLSQIFGTVGNVLQGSSGQILGKMFDIFNKGLMVVAALWLGVTTIHLTLKASQEGSFMGANKSVPFTMLRIALGFALIVPSSSTGYSLLQDIFMKVVVQSVGLADETWNAALGYLAYGGKLYIPPKTLSTSTTFVATAIGTASPQTTAMTGSGASAAFPLLPAVSQIFQSEVCMIRSGSKDWNPPAPGGGPEIQPTKYTAQFHPNQGTVFFPGLNQTTPITTTNASCGSVTSHFCAQSANSAYCWNSTVEQNPPALPTTIQTEKDDAYAAMKQLVIGMQSAAQAYVDYTDPPSGMASSEPPADFLNTNAKEVFSAMVSYGNLITPYQALLSNQIAHMGFVANAEAQGWIMAGAYYWNVQRTNRAFTAISISGLLPTVTQPIATNVNANWTQEDGKSINSWNELVAASQGIVGTDPSTNPGYQAEISKLWNQYVGAEQNNITVSSGQAASGGGSFASAMSSSALGSGIMTDFQHLNDTQGYNPIVVLMNEGDELLEAAVGMWIACIVLSIGIAIVAGICDSTSPAGLVLKTSLSWLKSIMMLFISLLLVPGAILAYYIPLYPFMIFTFAAVGWILIVIQGMAAAPLVCVGMTHPEGHDFLGKGEQALMFFLSIFLRPALLVIGLIASMLTSFVAFEFLLTGLGNLLGDMAHHGMNEGFLILISMIMMLVIFGAMTMQVIEQCYKLIFQLPDAVMQWIGGPQMGGDYGGMAGQVRGAVSSGASSTGQAVQGLDKGFEQFAGGIFKIEKSGGKITGGGATTPSTGSEASPTPPPAESEASPTKEGGQNNPPADKEG